MDDEKLLARVRNLLTLTGDAEKRARNLKASVALGAARCQLASALTILENEYGDKVRAAYDQAHLDRLARTEQ